MTNYVGHLSLHQAVEGLRRNVTEIDDFARSDEELGDLESDLIALALLEECRRDLATICADLTNRLAKVMPKTVVAEGYVFERHKKKSRTQWDKEDLLRAVLDTRQFDADGTDTSPLDKVLRVWNLGAPRTSALRDMGIDADQFCHVEDTGYQIQLAS